MNFTKNLKTIRAESKSTILIKNFYGPSKIYSTPRETTSLKGLCHEMNNFLGFLKSQYFLYMRSCI